MRGLWSSGVAASGRAGGNADGGAVAPGATANMSLLPIEKAPAFLHVPLCDARILTHLADLRRYPVVLELLAIRRVTHQSRCRATFAA